MKILHAAVERSVSLTQVDFAFRGVSVILPISVKRRRLKKSVAALALVFAFTLGGFALGLAHDQGPVDTTTYSLALRLDLTNGVSQWVGSGPRFHLDFLPANILQKDQKVAVEARVLNATPTSSETRSYYRRTHAPKIARHLLDSKLLI